MLGQLRVPTSGSRTRVRQLALSPAVLLVPLLPFIRLPPTRSHAQWPLAASLISLTVALTGQADMGPRACLPTARGIMHGQMGLSVQMAQLPFRPVVFKIALFLLGAKSLFLCIVMSAMSGAPVLLFRQTYSASLPR